jgi:hypothetical protein
MWRSPVAEVVMPARETAGVVSTEGMVTDGGNASVKKLKVWRGQAVIVIAMRGVLRDGLYVELYFVGRSSVSQWACKPLRALAAQCWFVGVEKVDLWAMEVEVAGSGRRD